MVVGPIPWRDFVLWAQVEGLDDEAARILWEVLIHLEQDRVAKEATKQNMKKMRGAA